MGDSGLVWLVHNSTLCSHRAPCLWIPTAAWQSRSFFSNVALYPRKHTLGFWGTGQPPGGPRHLQTFDSPTLPTRHEPCPWETTAGGNARRDPAASPKPGLRARMVMNSYQYRPQSRGTHQPSPHAPLPTCSRHPPLALVRTACLTLGILCHSRPATAVSSPVASQLPERHCSLSPRTPAARAPAQVGPRKNVASAWTHENYATDVRWMVARGGVDSHRAGGGGGGELAWGMESGR